MEKEEIYKITNSGKFIPVGELIRCEKCKKYRTVECEIWSDDSNWFCGDAKKKDENDDLWM